MPTKADAHRETVMRAAASASNRSCSAGWTIVLPVSAGDFLLLRLDRRLDVASAMPGGVTREVAGPFRRVFPPGEILVGCLTEREDDLPLNSAVERSNVGGPPVPPAFVDDAIDSVHIKAAQLRRPLFSAEDACGVLLPMDDVRECVFDRPGILRFGARDSAAPVGWLEPADQPIEPFVLAHRSLDHRLLRVPHLG
jgi:hypothetical protein